MATEPVKVAIKKRGRPKKAEPQSPPRARGRPGPEDTTVGPESLLEMTLAMLSENSPGDITRASLARYASVDPGLIRYYFKNRDSLMREAAQLLTRKLRERGAAALNQENLAPADRIGARINALLLFKLENPFYHRLMMEEMAKSADEESRKLFDKIAKDAIERYRGYLQAGIEDGSLRDVDPGFLYMAIIGICDFFVLASPVLAQHMHHDEAAGEMRDAYFAFTFDLLMNGLKPR